MPPPFVEAIAVLYGSTETVVRSADGEIETFVDLRCEMMKQMKLLKHLLSIEIHTLSSTIIP